ncbi:MAG: cupin domain-containing protein, partial [Gemmataceae bacterium]|nr:cupin domain-containing protein [Gemmataceae bacterium]
TVNPWPLIETIPQDMRHGREITPVMACKLAAGDWLYVPGGWWHRTEAGDDLSISLSVGVMPATALDAFDWLRSRLLRSLRWRQRLPHAASEEETRALFAELGADLARELGSEAAVRAFLADIACGSVAEG